MTVPKSYKGYLKLLIAIAEQGNEYRVGEKRLTQDEQMAIGGMIADIQNNLGEMQPLLEKFGLKYHG